MAFKMLPQHAYSYENYAVASPSGDLANKLNEGYEMIGEFDGSLFLLGKGRKDPPRSKIDPRTLPEVSYRSDADKPDP